MTINITRTDDGVFVTATAKYPGLSVKGDTVYEAALGLYRLLLSLHGVHPAAEDVILMLP